jgi:murein DD-endopeptidase MepM/ murein hydrolase activator NlpD
VLVGVLLFFVGVWQIIRPGARIRVNAETVAAFRVPHRAIGLLEFYAHRHDVPFAELFTIFNAENQFFPNKSVVHDLSVIEQLYVVDFERIKRRYNARSVAPYAKMFENLFNELEVFPIPAGWYDVEPSIMYGDSWGMTHNVQGNRTHMGTAIIDRENIRGRVPVVSMTHGRVEEAGWNNQLGYFVGITTINGTYYLYAHLDSITQGLRSGHIIHAGQPLGYMGNSGGGRSGGNFPVHLHVGISPEAAFTRGRFWINPYPLLRYMEDR